MHSWRSRGASGAVTDRRRAPAPRRAGRGPVRGGSWGRRLAAAALAVVTAGTGLAATAVPAAAETVHEITGEWESKPDTAGRGDVVTAVWRVNVNDDAPAPANDPVENVTFTVTLENGAFRAIPDLCATADVDPVSAISEDGRTLTCNMGTVVQGTAVVVQTPVVVDGDTGQQVTATGEIAGLQAPLDPIEILNDFGMDMQFGGNTAYYVWNEDYTSVNVDLQWALRLAARSEQGPDDATYRLRVTDSNGAPVTVGTGIYGDAGCSPFNANRASGVPWSELPGYPADQQTDFVEECTLAPVPGQPGWFDLTLSGIDYDLSDVPTRDSTIAGNPLPTDWSYIASGSLWFDVATNQAGSITLQSNAPVYTSTTGLTSTDLTENNTTNKTYVLPGRWAAPWYRAFTGAGGTNWDDTYRVAAGTTVSQYVNNRGSRLNVPDTTLGGQCLVFDTDYVTYTPRPDGALPMIRGFERTEGGGAGQLVNPPPIEYYVGDAVGDPNDFVCGTDPASWTTTEPEDLSTVQAVRILYPHSVFAAEGYNGIQLMAYTTINPDVPVGQDIWMFGSVLANGVWEGPGEPWDSTVTVATPDARYPSTNGRRDILRTIFATPTIQKSGDRQVVRPGDPATFTLTYSANGSGSIPETVDDYTIVDTLPAGMTYVEGSADPAPAVTTNGEGQQVLTWTLDGVPTNTRNTLTYQAVADESVTPGQTLTNTATSSLRGQTSLPATAQVTVSTNGITQLGKSTDQWFIANPDGSGVGEGSWTVTLRSQDPLPQAWTDTIDILPHNGDGRGTDYEGTYDVTSVEVPEGATVYYTTTDPAELSDDPEHESNGAPGTIEGNDVGWTTEPTANPTAIRVIGGVLPPGATIAFRINIATDGAEPGDVWMNSAQSRAEHTELVMRTSEPLTMGTSYSASLKKYVQDVHGEWHDAQDASDYPMFHPGDTIRYRIVIENTGQGALTNVRVTDDRQPELGSFVVETLEPGATESHEFEIVADESLGQGVVNTASATADQPADSVEPPLIPSDPAGIELEGIPTHTKELLSAAPVGDGQWEVVYGIDVENTTNLPTTYSLADTLHFTDEVTVSSATVTASPEGVTLAEPAWDGQEELAIASAVALLPNEDAEYAPHHYEVTVVADVPLQLPGAGSGDDSDPTACPAEGSELDADTAFNNVSAMTDGRGVVEEDQACAPIPSIDIAKSVVGEPVADGETWTVTYDIVVANAGQADGQYDLTDRLRFGKAIQVREAQVTGTPEGVTALGTWTGRGSEGAAENVVVTDVALPAGAEHTYRVEVVSTLGSGTDASTFTCPEPGSGEPGGFANTAGVGHNALTDSADACATPDEPVVGSTGPLPRTGATVGGIVGAAAVLLLLGLAVTAVARRRLMA